MTYGMQADGPVYGLGADLYSSIHQEARIGVAVSRAVRAERIAERERCAKVADMVATKMALFNHECWATAREISAKIRGNE